MTPTARVICSGCGHVASPENPTPFACPDRGKDDRDHVMVTHIERADELVREAHLSHHDHADNPFVRYRKLLYSWHYARAHGMDDERFVDRVCTLDERVAAVDGQGFRRTPCSRATTLGVWIKDDTGNVSGSHKSRHLMGIALQLAVAAEVDHGVGDRPLAIASCGNAALAAAVVARALDHRLLVYLPPWAHPAVCHSLRDLGAEVVVCERTASSPPGDPCYHRFVAAVAAGAVPFACQGNENGMTLDGGRTLGWEILAEPTVPTAIDRLFVQVGGGALASAVFQAFAWAQVPLPALHPVQTTSGHPLERSWRLLGTKDVAPEDRTAYAAAHRSELMWPWESAPQSLASGILDDETYDWLALIDGMQASGGCPIVVDEHTIRSAHTLATSETRIPVDATGSAGLAGVLAARAGQVIDPSETVLVLFTGRDRTAVGAAALAATL